VAGNVGPSFNRNILNYGRLRNLIAAEESRFFRQATEYQNAVLNANREAEDNIVAFLQSQVQAAQLREGIEAAAESRSLVFELYRGGRADFNRVYIAELTLAEQQDLLAVAEGEIAQSLVGLYRALGGGWEIRLNSVSSPAMTVAPPNAPAMPAEQAPLPPEPVPLPLGKDAG
jgi:outer membrane protein TolC